MGRQGSGPNSASPLSPVSCGPHSHDPEYSACVVSVLLSLFCLSLSHIFHSVPLLLSLCSMRATPYGRPSEIEAATWPLAMSVLFASCVGATAQVSSSPQEAEYRLTSSHTQAFFAYKIRLLLQDRIVPAISWCGAVLRVVFSVALCVLLTNSTSLPIFVSHFRWLWDVQIVLCVGIDVLHATSLWLYLRRYWSRWEE